MNQVAVLIGELFQERRRCDTFSAHTSREELPESCLQENINVTLVASHEG